MPAELSRTTRMPYGLTNAAVRQTMSNYGAPDPTWARQISLEYIDNNDALALTENGGATVALAAGVGGAATITTGAAANTLGAASTNQAVFQAPSNSNGLGRMFFKWSGAIDSLVGTLQVGFVASAAAAPQGIFIQSTVTTGALTGVIRNGTGTTLVPFPANCALVAATNVELGIEVDFEGNTFFYWNPTTGNVQPNTNGTIPNGPVAAAYAQINGALNPAMFLPTSALFASQGAIPTTAVARAVTVNFFVAAQQFGAY